MLRQPEIHCLVRFNDILITARLKSLMPFWQTKRVYHSYQETIEFNKFWEGLGKIITFNSLMFTKITCWNEVEIVKMYFPRYTYFCLRKLYKYKIPTTMISYEKHCSNRTNQGSNWYHHRTHYCYWFVPVAMELHNKNDNNTTKVNPRCAIRFYQSRGHLITIVW